MNAIVKPEYVMLRHRNETAAWEIYCWKDENLYQFGSQGWGRMFRYSPVNWEALCSLRNYDYIRKICPIKRHIRKEFPGISLELPQ